MEANEILKQISLDVFGTNDGFRPKFPKTGESIQEAMERSFKAGEKKVAEWIESNSIFGFIADHKDYIKYRRKWREFLKSEVLNIREGNLEDD